MAYAPISTEQLTDELSNSAVMFSASLNQMVMAIDGDVSRVIRKGALDVFRNIVKRSAVDTGAYRASHGIANMEPADDADIVKGQKGSKIPASFALSKLQGWQWKLGDGDIFIFNNLPYAERLENGWSQQAPAGVYRVALAEMTQILNQEIANISGFETMGGEGE